MGVTGNFVVWAGFYWSGRVLRCDWAGNCRSDLATLHASINSPCHCFKICLGISSSKWRVPVKYQEVTVRRLSVICIVCLLWRCPRTAGDILRPPCRREGRHTIVSSASPPRSGTSSFTRQKTGRRWNCLPRGKASVSFVLTFLFVSEIGISCR